MCDSLGEGRGSTVGWRATVLWITLKLRCICTTESEKVTLWYFRNTREKADCSERIQGKSPSIRHSRSQWIPLSRLIPLSELIPLPLSTLTGVPLSSLIPDKNKLITINLIRMIFILLWFCACRKDLLPGGSSPSLLASSHLRYPVGLRVRPRSARDAAKRYLYILYGAMALPPWKRLHTMISPWANTIALCAELPSDQPTTVDWPSDKLTNLNHPFMN